MLNRFDWLRLSRSGTELLATLGFHMEGADLFPESGDEIGPPVTAFTRPCGRCRIYPGDPEMGIHYCRTCLPVLARAKTLQPVSRRAVLVWGYVNRLPAGLREWEGFYAENLIGRYVQDNHHFLLALERFHLKNWLQELLLYHGSDLKGLLQIFPPVGKVTDRQGVPMGDILCRVISNDARFPMDRLRVRFFSSPFQSLSPHVREKKSLLTMDVAEFMKWLEMAGLFRTMLRPEQQNVLQDLLRISNPREERFYWGRFIGFVSPEAKDMLNAWKIRQWSKNEIRFLYELLPYARF